MINIPSKVGNLSIGELIRLNLKDLLRGAPIIIRMLMLGKYFIIHIASVF
jgi:hypothetical protein